MANFKALAKDTAIYGVSSIVGRFLNYLLVPLYTYKITAASGGYGVVTELYAYTALLLVILTYGMETTFFRFANKEGEDPKMVFSTILRMVGLTSALFAGLVLAFLGPISRGMGYASQPAFVGAMAATVALDAFQAILFSYLRYQKKAIKFASLKLLFIFLNITLNLVYFVVLPKLGVVSTLNVGYVFYINLFCTATITFFFAKELKGITYGFDGALMRRMLAYTWPLLILGIAGILNQTADKILFPHIYPGEDAKMQLGIYGAASKIAMIMAMITQAFRYAYEPFVFGGAKEKDSRETYAKGMRYFLVFTLLAYLCVLAFLPVLRYIISPEYWDGLRVVPIVMAAEILMGVYFNLSFWYKLSDRTLWGAVFSGVGCAVLIGVNLVLVPRIGYMGCAWGGVAGYGSAMLLSYLVGQRYEPVNYRVPVLLAYVALTAALSLLVLWSGDHLGRIGSLALNTLAVLAFAGVVFRVELQPVLRARHNVS
ncbi:MAG: polysaccharide biosynthesis protein [Bacteroidales bacterium]|nr:polysaccharide biosynthesis protein [Bacteroidales bacterium]